MSGGPIFGFREEPNCIVPKFGSDSLAGMFSVSI
jgi:hypothetical protein